MPNTQKERVFFIAPVIVTGKIGKIISKSSTYQNEKPISLMITVLYYDWSGKNTVQRSTTFHIHLEPDGNYHYRWSEVRFGQETNIPYFIEHDQCILASPSLLLLRADEKIN